MLRVEKKEQLTNDDINEWNQLWEKEESASFWSSYNWYIACKETAFPSIEVWFAYQDTELVAVVSLEARRYRFVKCLMSFGQPYTDKSTILIKKEYSNFIPDIVKNLGTKIPVILTEIEYSQCQVLLADVTYEISSVSPYLDMSQDITQQVKKYEWNKLNRKVDNCTYNFVVYHGEEAHNNIDKVWEIEELSNKANRGRSRFINETIKNLYRKASGSPYTMIAVLLDGDRTIACKLGFFERNKQFILHNWSYDDTYKEATPGRLILLMTLKYLITRDCKKYDFSRGESIIKSHFSKYTENNYTLIYNAGNFYLKWFKIWIKIREMHLNAKKKNSFLHKQMFKIWQFFKLGNTT